jgi:hypothetical protein
VPTDFEIALENRPGELGRLGKAFGGASLNILGFCATTAGDAGTVHLLVDDPDAARKALDALGLSEYRERKMAVLDAEDSPGRLGQIATEVAEQGGNIELAYTIVGGARIAIAADDPGAVG